MPTTLLWVGLTTKYDFCTDAIFNEQSLLTIIYCFYVLLLNTSLTDAWVQYIIFSVNYSILLSAEASAVTMWTQRSLLLKYNKCLVGGRFKWNKEWLSS